MKGHWNLFLWLIIIIIPLPAFGGRDDDLSKELNRAIKNRFEFIQQRQRQIDYLKDTFLSGDTPINLEYEVNNQLYGLYKKMQQDSAMRWDET